jgi:transposase-like protein
MTDLATSGATRRLEVLAGPERRRRYNASEKAALVAETLRPGACAARIARRHGLHPQQLYTWRRQARRGELAFRVSGVPIARRLAPRSSRHEIVDPALRMAGDDALEDIGQVGSILQNNLHRGRPETPGEGPAITRPNIRSASYFH